MRNKTIILSASCLALLVLILYGCQKYDSASSEDSNKGYAYFEATMSSDKNINGVASEMNKVKLLMKYNLDKNLKFARNTKTKATISAKRKEIKLHGKKLQEQAKQLKTQADFLKFQTALGFGPDGKAILDAFEKQKQYLLEFVKLNPDFKLLKQDEQVKLLVHAYNDIRKNRKKIFYPAQEKTQDDCINASESSFDTLETAFNVALAALQVQEILCIVLSEGIATPACIELYILEGAAIETVFWLSYADIVTTLNECLAALPPPPPTV